MSITFESPSHRRPVDAYFTPMTVPNSMLTTNSMNNATMTNHSGILSNSDSGNSNNSSNSNNNTDETSSGGTTPYFTAPINPMLNQDFMNAIHQRHSSQPTVFSPTMERKPAVALASGGSIADRRRAARQQVPPLNCAPAAPPPSLPSSTSSGPHPITSEQLTAYLTNSASSLLVLDVRSFVQFSHARIRKAINVSVPNTILKRPTFTMEKLYEATVDADRSRLKQWSSCSVIVFYDQSSMVASEQCATSYLANKMIHAGYKGSLCYLQGKLK